MCQCLFFAWVNAAALSSITTLRDVQTPRQKGDDAALGVSGCRLNDTRKNVRRVRTTAIVDTGNGRRVTAS